MSLVLTKPRRDALAAIYAIHPQTATKHSSTWAQGGHLFVNGKVADWLAEQGHVEVGHVNLMDDFRVAVGGREIRLTAKGIAAAKALPAFSAQDDTIAKLIADTRRKGERVDDAA